MTLWEFSARCAFSARHDSYLTFYQQAGWRPSSYWQERRPHCSEQDRNSMCPPPPLCLTEAGHFQPCMVETRSRKKKRKEKKKRSERMPAPSGNFSFLPNWGIESRILLSYKPLFLSHPPRDMNHFQPPGPLHQTQGTRSYSPKGNIDMTCMNSFRLKQFAWFEIVKSSAWEYQSSNRYCGVRL